MPSSTEKRRPTTGKQTNTRQPATRQAAQKKAAPKKAAQKKAAGKPKFTARTADKHVLYQLAVQAPEYDAKVYARWFEKYAGRPLRSMREDFCGTAVLVSHHVKRHPENTGIGVDLDRTTLDWGIEHNVRRLLDAEQQQRLTLLQQNVLDVTSPKVDCVLALNFSYSVFKTREELGRYIKTVYRSLKPGGVFYMDGWGGPDVLKVKTDKTRHKGFTYLWEQRSYDPITHHMTTAISFEFPDGTKLRNAFTYDWRLWSLAEIRELFVEAGFDDVHVLWEGTDQATGSGNGRFTRKQVGDADECWICFVVGRKAG